MDSVDCTHQKRGCTTAQEEVQEGRARRGSLRPHLSRFSVLWNPYSRMYCARNIAGWPEAEIDLIIASWQACLAVKYGELLRWLSL